MKLRVLLVAVIILFSFSTNAEWPESGIVVCDEEHYQAIAAITSDNAGGAIIVWSDNRDLIRSKYFGQRIDSAGVPLWTPNGVAVCDTANNNLLLFSVISDGAGGAILTWTHTPAFKEDNIYAQRIRFDGYSMWSHDGMPVCTVAKKQSGPRCTSDGANGLLVTWEDYRVDKADVYAQRIRAEGIAAWTANGVRISYSPESEWCPSLTSDEEGGAIIAWQDNLNGNWDIYAERINANGLLQWGTTPVYVGEGSQIRPILAPDGAHGAIIVWDDEVFNSDFYAQRIAFDGTLLWNTAGVPVCEDNNDQDNPRIISDSGGGAFVLWEDPRNGNVDIYGQRIDADGNVLWGVNGKPLVTHSTDQRNFGATRDDLGGLILTWIDNRSGQNGIYALKVDSSGDPVWDPDGITVNDDLENITYCKITTDMDGGALLAYSGNYPGSSLDIFAQQLDASGGVIATLLAEHSVGLVDDGVRLDWSLSEIETGISFNIYRSTNGSSAFVRLHGIHGEDYELSYSFLDSEAIPGNRYCYRVSVFKDSREYILFETDEIEIPLGILILYSNYPNPFNPNTTISFYIPSRTGVKIDIYSADGSHIRNLVSSVLDDGLHRIGWDGCDGSGQSVVSGVYYCRLKTRNNTVSKKLVIVR